MKIDEVVRSALVAGVLLISATVAYSMYKLFLVGFNPIGLIINAVLVSVAAIMFGFAFFGDVPRFRAALRVALSAGITFGGTAFAVGFFGPIIFAPGANQGPLLGIFITGPLGFIAGCVGGALYALFRKEVV